MKNAKDTAFMIFLGMVLPLAGSWRAPCWSVHNLVRMAPHLNQAMEAGQVLQSKPIIRTSSVSWPGPRGDPRAREAVPYLPKLRDSLNSYSEHVRPHAGANVFGQGRHQIGTRTAFRSAD